MSFKIQPKALAELSRSCYYVHVAWVVAKQLFGVGRLVAWSAGRGRNSYRLRIGNYRVIFDEDETTMLAIYIGRRTTTTYKRS